METLVFSHHQQVIHVYLYIDQFIVTCSTQIILFDIGNAKIIYSLKLHEDLMPIHSWVFQQKLTSIYTQIQDYNLFIILQGKMGQNCVINLERNKGFTFVRKYSTKCFGFCKMSQIQSLPYIIIGLNEQENTINGYNILNGDLILKAIVIEQKICESVSCICAESEQNQQKLSIYTAQQGCTIYKFQSLLSTQDNEVDSISRIKLPNKMEISLVISMYLKDSHLFCLMRKVPTIYILSTEPQLNIKYSVKFQLSLSPCNLMCIPQKNNKLQSSQQDEFIFSYENRIVRLNKSAKQTIVGELKQSKNIQYLQVRDGVIFGCTQEKQFFYIDL